MSANSIANSPGSWTWPEDVRKRLDAQRIGAPPKDQPKAEVAKSAPAPAPAPAPSAQPDEDDDMYMYGGYGC
jgi:hypothetical protein